MTAYKQEDFDPTNVKLDGYGDTSKRLVIHPQRTHGVLEAGNVKGYALDNYYVAMSIGILPPRPNMEAKGFYSIKMIPKNPKDPMSDEGKWKQMIKVRPEGFLGVMSYSISAYLVMRQLQGFTTEKMMEELASSFDSGKYDAGALKIDYDRLIRDRGI